MSAVCIRFRASALSENNAKQLHATVVERVEKSGKFRISTTELKGKTWFRINPVNFRTRSHMEQLLVLHEKEGRAALGMILQSDRSLRSRTESEKAEKLVTANVMPDGAGRLSSVAPATQTSPPYPVLWAPTAKLQAGFHPTQTRSELRGGRSAGDDPVGNRWRSRAHLRGKSKHEAQVIPLRTNEW